MVGDGPYLLPDCSLACARLLLDGAQDKEGPVQEVTPSPFLWLAIPLISGSLCCPLPYAQVE